MAEFRLEPFDKESHGRTGFGCGQPALDEFIHVLVTQYEKRRLGKTFVAVPTDDPGSVVGYYTLAAGAVAFAHLPHEVAKKLPKHPVPVVLLARLAVDRTAQGLGLGETLLMDALKRAVELSRSVGVFAVEVLAIDEPAVSFYAKYGFASLLDSSQHMYLPISAAEQAVTVAERKQRKQ